MVGVERGQVVGRGAGVPLDSLSTGCRFGAVSAVSAGAEGVETSRESLVELSNCCELVRHRGQASRTRGSTHTQEDIAMNRYLVLLPAPEAQWALLPESEHEKGM